MKKAFSYFFKDRLKFLLLISFIAIVFTFLFTSTGSGIKINTESGTALIANFANGPISFVSAILATFIPIYEFSFKMKKVNVDHYYSLPIERRDLYYSKFLVGFTNLLISVTLSFFTVFFFYLFNIDISLFNFLGFLLLYGSLIISSAIIYVFVSYFFMITNTLLDGVVVVILASCALPFFYITAIQTFIEVMVNYGDFSFLFPYSPMTFLPIISGHEITYHYSIYDLNYTKYYIPSSIIGLVVNLVVAGLCMYGINHYIDHHKGEDSSQISNHPLAYKSLIPLYLMCGLLISFESGGIESILIVIALFIVGAYVLYCVYKRRIILEKKDWFNLVLYTIIGVGLPIIKALVVFVIDFSIL